FTTDTASFRPDSNCNAIIPYSSNWKSVYMSSSISAMSNALLSSLPNAASKDFAFSQDPSDIGRVAQILIRSSNLIFLLLATGIMYPMMRTQGLGLAQYWVGNYIYAFMTISILNIIYFLVAMFATLLLWTHAQVCLAVFLGSLVTKTVSAGMVSYLLHIGSAIAAPFFVAIADDVGVIPIWYGLFPPIGVTNVFNILMVNRNQFAALFPGIVTVFGSAVLGLLGCYIHAIRPSPVGIPVHPLLGLEKLRSRKKSSGFIDDTKDIEGSADHIDDDVAAEKHAVAMAQGSGVMDPHEAVRIANLRKHFPNKLAVDNISLSIKYGETFGLLGPNGAGKTTTLSMITGLLERTSGSIVIGGKDMDVARAQRGGSNSLWRVVGVTPQFDTVWPELTVEEHLTFYCRLPWAARKELAGMVRRIAEDIELDGDAFRTKASGLSGGMRRRLSIGISLTADPKILVLDEPTTGLDAEAKRQVWKIIDGIRRGGGDRCVIITTHSMEEADALCSRIGIVCDGNLKVLGSQLHLKKKFGNGFKVTHYAFPHRLDFHPFSHTDVVQLSYLEHQQSIRVSKVSDEIQRTLISSSRDLYHTSLSMSITSSDIHASATQNLSWMVTLTWVLPRASVDVAEVFWRIANWALTETTLEDVFVKVVEG
ncbi:P-loop containing nucleoside triphosphate hydrolase protein, partial [Chytridium lagenaria]